MSINLYIYVIILQIIMKKSEKIVRTPSIFLALVSFFTITNVNAQTFTNSPNLVSANNNIINSKFSNNDNDKVSSSIQIGPTIHQAQLSKANLRSNAAISIAENTTHPNSRGLSTSASPLNGFIVYDIKILKSKQTANRVITDPGNEEVLALKDLSIMVWMMTIHKEKHQDKDMMGLHSR